MPGSEHYVSDRSLARKGRTHQVAYFAHLSDEHKDAIRERLNDEFGALTTYNDSRLEKLGHAVE